MELNDATFLLYAAKSYHNPSCTGVDEFYEDLNRFKYLKRLFKKYEDTGDLKERLILNHIIILYNVFEKDRCTEMLLFKLDKYVPMLKPFLLFLNYWNTDDNIEMDTGIIEALRKVLDGTGNS